MIWKSILEGFLIFRFWQIWLCSIVFVTLLYASRITLMLLFSKSNLNEINNKGFIKYYTSLHISNFIGNLLEGILLSIFIALISPILLGGDILTFQIFMNIFGQIIIAGVIAALVFTILSFIPFLNFESPAITMFIEGLIIFWFLYGRFINMFLDDADIPNNIYPSIIEIILIIIISLVIGKIISFTSYLVSALLSEKRYGGFVSVIFALLGLMFQLLGGIIPLFIFISYIKLAIEKLG